MRFGFSPVAKAAITLALLLAVAGGTGNVAAQGLPAESKTLPAFSPVVSFVEVATGKIHAATVTQANLNYMGSITIDADLLDAARSFRT